jgi:transposase
VLRGATAPQKRGFRRLQRKALRRARLRRLIGDRPEAAIDGTGLDSRHASTHYARRKGKRYRMRRYVLLAVACHTKSHLITAAEVRLGPTNESPLLADLIDQAPEVRWDRVLADAAYDAEHNHELCRDDHEIRSTVIPVNRRRSGRKWPRSKYRRQMRRRFHKRKYGQRWQVESTFSRHKRLLGAALRSRSDAARERECYLRVLTHNLMLLAAVDS